MSKVVKNALISVYDKTGIVDFAKGLHKLNWRIYASGGTYAAIKKGGIPAIDVAELVGGKAILGHKVVTLSREIAAGLLADLNDKDEMVQMHKLNLPVFQLICQDSYPLEEEIANPKATAASVLQQSDIGGPTMLREAAKGARILGEAAKEGRIVLSVADQRQSVLDWLKAGKPNQAEFIEQLAARAVYEAARYALIEAKYWNGDNVSGHIALKSSPTKYGENPQQADAALYADNRLNPYPLGLDQFKHVKGWELSYINEIDIVRLVQTITHIATGFGRNFGKVPPMAVGVKHGNACGAAVGETLVDAVEKMIDGDTRAIFGGVVIINGKIDTKVAKALMNHSMEGGKRMLDGVIGASVTPEALEILRREKLRVVINPALAGLNEWSLDTSRIKRQVPGGMLEQPNYTFVMDLSAEYMQQYGKLTKQQKRDLILAWAVGSTSNSNTITLVKNSMVIGNGVGQQDRVGAAQLAISRTTVEFPAFEDNDGKLFMKIPLDREKLQGAVAYSDSFFPFPDGPMVLAEVGIKAILASSGSVMDDKVIETLTGAGVSLVMVPDKIGRGFFGH